MNIAVFASGRGTNFSAIVRAVKKGAIRANLALLVSDNPQAGALARAARAGIKAVIIERKNFPDKAAFEKEIIRNLKENNIDLVVLAGFMRILGPDIIREYRNRIINIHPALLPSFKGAHAIKDALDYGVKVTGVTVHLVDEEMDHGPIILQEPVKIKEGDTLGTLEAKIHKIEHKLYPRAINLYIRGQKTAPFRVRMNNGRSVFRSKKPRASARGASFLDGKIGLTGRKVLLKSVPA